MNNLVLLCQELSNCYYYTQQRLTDDFYFNHGTKMQVEFFKYLHDQVDFGNFFKKLTDHHDVVLKDISEFMSNMEHKFQLAAEVQITTTRILDTPIALNPTLKDELWKVVSPITDSYNRLYSVYNNFDKNDSAGLIGSNWKLKKIFHNWKQTKTVNPIYVLTDEVVTEIINNYFLYLKFGGS